MSMPLADEKRTCIEMFHLNAQLITNIQNTQGENCFWSFSASAKASAGLQAVWQWARISGVCMGAVAQICSWDAQVLVVHLLHDSHRRVWAARWLLEHRNFSRTVLSPFIIYPSFFFFFFPPFVFFFSLQQLYDDLDRKVGKYLWYPGVQRYCGYTSFRFSCLPK